MKFENFTTDKNSVTQWRNRIVWSIENFMELSDQHKKIHSPNFTHSNNDFGKGQLSVVTFLDIKSRKQCVKINFKFNISNPAEIVYSCAIINKEGLSKFSSQLHKVLTKPSEYCFSMTMAKSKFYDENGIEQLTTDGTLTISCNFRLLPGARRNEDLLFIEFGKLLNNDNLTDVTIKVGKKEFRAHRIILIARSDYFKDLLTNKTRNSITIEGVDEVHFSIILNYVYRGFIDHDSLATKTLELLRISDMFKLNELKEICEIEMSAKLAIISVTWIFQMSEKYSAKILKKASIDFISVFFKYVIPTKSWEKLIKSDPHLVIAVTLPKAKTCKCVKKIINN